MRPADSIVKNEIALLPILDVRVRMSARLFTLEPSRVGPRLLGFP
jgi:hypothetical protein